MHMQRKWSSGVLVSLLFTLSLAACSSGGGDGSNDAPAATITGTAEGLWTGTTGNGHTVRGVVLDDGTYWFLYSAVGNPALMAGALQGGGSSQNGTFASPVPSDGLDFSNGVPPLIQPEIFPVTVAASYVMGNSLSGEVRYPGALPFTSTFDSEYNVAPVIANVAGTYPGSVFGFPHTMTISTLGVITVTTTGGPHTTGVPNVTGIELGCDFTGTLSPRSNGNVYDISLTPDPSNIVTFAQCNPATLTGVAFFDAATTNKKIYVLALNSSRNRVFPFTGTRP